LHIIIAAITAIAGLIWALNSLQRSGFDLNSLNPWYWARRKRWENKQINPLYAVDSPRELAALLMFAALKLTGDPTSEQKQNLLSLYRKTLHYTDKEALEMYSVCSHLLNTDPNYLQKIPSIVAPSLESISDDQRLSILSGIESVIEFGGSDIPTETELYQNVHNALVK